MSAGEEKTDRLVVVEQQQDQRKADHPDNLRRHTNVVNNGNQPYSRNIDERTDDDREQGDENSIWHSQDSTGDIRENGKQRNGNGKRDRCDGQYASEEVNPAGKPAQRWTGESLAPLIDRTRDGEVRGEFRKIQCHDE